MSNLFPICLSDGNKLVKNSIFSKDFEKSLDFWQDKDNQIFFAIYNKPEILRNFGGLVISDFLEFT